MVPLMTCPIMFIFINIYRVFRKECHYLKVWEKTPLGANKCLLKFVGALVVCNLWVLYFQEKLFHSITTNYRTLNLYTPIFEVVAYTFLKNSHWSTYRMFNYYVCLNFVFLKSKHLKCVLSSRTTLLPSCVFHLMQLQLM